MTAPLPGEQPRVPVEGLGRNVPAPGAEPSMTALPAVNHLDFAIVSSSRAGGRYDICLEGAARRLWMG
jgi:hypothetical protein